MTWIVNPSPFDSESTIFVKSFQLKSNKGCQDSKANKIDPIHQQRRQHQQPKRLAYNTLCLFFPFCLSWPQKRTCGCVTLWPCQFTLKSIFKAKRRITETQIFHHPKIYISKNPLKETQFLQDIRTLYNSTFNTSQNYHPSKNFM
jgi:hypothetical protein